MFSLKKWEWHLYNLSCVSNRIVEPVEIIYEAICTAPTHPEKDIGKICPGISYLLLQISSSLWQEIVWVSQQADESGVILTTFLHSLARLKILPKPDIYFPFLSNKKLKKAAVLLVEMLRFICTNAVRPGRFNCIAKFSANTFQSDLIECKSIIEAK